MKRYVDPKVGQTKSGIASNAKAIALSHQYEAAIGKKSATIIPNTAVNAKPTNGCRGVFIARGELVRYTIRRLTGEVPVLPGVRLTSPQLEMTSPKP